jgi:hypothetical protein
MKKCPLGNSAADARELCCQSIGAEQAARMKEYIRAMQKSYNAALN